MGLPLLFLLTGSFNLAPPGASRRSTAWTIGCARFTDPGTLSALWMSFLLSVVRLIPAMILSVLFAWLIARTDMPGGKFLEVGLLDCLLRSRFSVGAGLDFLARSQLRLSQHAGAEPAVGRRPLFDPYGFWGIVWVHTSTGGIWFKVMLLVPVFRRLGATLEEAARVAGANTATMLRRITSAGVVADDSRGLGAELHSRPAVLQHRAFARHAVRHLRLFNKNLRLPAPRAARLRRSDGVGFGLFVRPRDPAVFLLEVS